MRPWFPHLAVLVLWLGLWPAGGALASGEVRRFAVIAGNDEGGTDTRPLLYAREDARKIHDILLRLGGVQREDATLLLNESAEGFLRALSDAEQKAARARQAGERTALLVYYSGHAKEGHLRLGASRLEMAALRRRLMDTQADVRIAILDACRSGLLTRTKGARRAPEFEVESDASRAATGTVILTSSASDEESQESDELGGSYFSHHLATALVGEADRSGDGRVTLSEAYAYAYQRTVADTAESWAGAQHPTFSYELAGNGDLVLTELSARREGLVFLRELPAGTYYVVNDRGFVTAEVSRQANTERRLALPPGQYRVKRRLSDRLQLAQLTVAAGESTLLPARLFRDAPFSDDPVKGGLLRSYGGQASFTVALSAGYQSFFDATTRDALFPPLALFGLEGELRNFLRRDWVWSFDLLFGTVRTPFAIAGTQAFARFQEVNLGSTLGVEWPLGPFRWLVGARVTGILMTRRFEELSDAVSAQVFLTFSPGVATSIGYQLGSVSVSARARAHYLFYNLDPTQLRSLGFWDFGLVFGYRL